MQDHEQALFILTFVPPLTNLYCNNLWSTAFLSVFKTLLCLQVCRPKEKSSNWHFFDFHFFAKNYNLVNALSCVLVIFLEKKLNAWKRVFFRFAKSSICISTYEIFHVSPRKKAVSSSPRKKAVSAEIVLFFSLFIITISLLIKYCCFLPVYRHTCRKFLINLNWIQHWKGLQKCFQRCW